MALIMPASTIAYVKHGAKQILMNIAHEAKFNLAKHFARC